VFESLSLYICPFAVRDVYVVFGFCHDREVNRRGFLSALIAAGTAAAIDPEKLLWEPGRKLISIPKPRRIVNGFRVGDIVTFQNHFAINPFTLGETTEFKRFIVTEAYQSGRVLAELKLIPSVALGPEDFQAAALAARGSVVNR
jgi:hypothetical protein